MGMTTDTDHARSRPGARALVLSGLLVVLLAVAAAMSAATVAWGDQLRTEGRLLPGTTVATVDVGGSTEDEAVEAVQAHLAQRLDRDLVVTHGQDRWTTTARELGGTADVAAAVAAALDHTESAGFGDLARMRWANGTADVSAEVGVEVPDEGIDAFVAGIATDVDRAPVDADATWAGDHVVVADEVIGRAVDHDAAADAVRELLTADADTVELPVTEVAPRVRTELVREVADAVEAAVRDAYDHTVTVGLEDVTQRLTPRDVGATNDAEAVLAAALERAAGSGDVTVDGVELAFPDGSLTAVVDSLAAGKEVAGRDAEITFANGEFTVVPERTGIAVDRSQARERLAAALRGDTDEVSLELVTTRPSVTADSFGTVLLLDQSARELHLYRGAERQRSWPVAVGTNNSPTPTGTFVIGAKRFEPTWVNPAPDRWGRDMPASIGPGPDNPLGPRALNWNTKQGRDTLIRFHGTPNEASVGSASSNGCVRMYNADVIELYDLVSSGTTIVSVA
ncbi:peptidoglycan binding domain-containing protein [Egicoccus sp. AB-alg2]|uniref:L,D-transpeptidase family protein n=1 Tax=Egicoccus sp. AB-alg2 TaxID=3242693 RepID=UPI00359D75D1